MSTSRAMLTDALLRDALIRRAAGPRSTAGLLDDVLLVVQSTTQRRSWAIQLPRPSRPLAVLVVGALLASALVGSALMAGARLVTPTVPLVDGIAFAQARYSWDGSKDWNGAPTPTVEDQRILRVPSAGGEPMFIAEVPAADRQTLVGYGTVGPAVQWAPDGSRIAFRLYNDAPGIYVMNRDGSGMTRLTDFPEPGATNCVPVGTGPVVTCSWGEQRGKVAWSPDGTRIAFTSPLRTDGPGGSRSSSLYVVDTRDGRLTELTGPNDAGGAFPPIAWSPDGSRIAFARSRGALRSSTNSLVVMDADATDEVLLVQVEFADLGPLAWSPDGSRIAFMRSSAMVGNEDGAGGMWVVNPDGTDVQQIATGPRAGPTELRTVFDGPFEWSSDGIWIATLSGPHGGIMLVAADGSEERVIVDPGPGKVDSISHFAWSPDGSQLVFSDGGGAMAESPPTWDPPSIYVVNADGTGLRWLADGEYPDWSR
jgi:Tol biopolymer transport system component